MVWRFFKKLGILLDPSIPLLGLYPKNLKPLTDTHYRIPPKISKVVHFIGMGMVVTKEWGKQRVVV